MLFLCLSIPNPMLAAQEGSQPDVPPVFLTLQGTWEGSGTLLGRPARFQMHWEIVGNGFVRLGYSNSWVAEGGDDIPVLSSQATYLLEGSSGLGVWIDDRPQRLILDVAVTDSSVITIWTAEAEVGRTEYVVQSNKEVLVRDFVSADDSERLFAEAVYRRRTSSTNADGASTAAPSEGRLLPPGRD
ncbi:MAG: hypothetical protein KJN92_02540 [Gemmatimonadetes bacterium]|nr:hypothetical protein [Gemmatimonadota bacterium]